MTVLCLVMSDSLRPHGLWSARLRCPRDSPGKKTGVSRHALLQGIFPTQETNPSLPHRRQIPYYLGHLITKPKVLFKKYSLTHTRTERQKKEKKKAPLSLNMGPSSSQGVLKLWRNRMPHRSSNKYIFKPLTVYLLQCFDWRTMWTFSKYISKITLKWEKNHRRNPRKLLAYPLKEKAQLFRNSSPIQKYLRNKRVLLRKRCKNTFNLMPTWENSL